MLILITDRTCKVIEQIYLLAVKQLGGFMLFCSYTNGCLNVKKLTQKKRVSQ